MLEARRLTKYYSAIPAIRDVSFTLEPGTILGLLGPNGSGKSTTVSLLTGLREPSAGEIWFDGHAIHQLPSAADISCSGVDRLCCYERRILALHRLDRAAVPVQFQGRRHGIGEDLLRAALHAVEDGPGDGLR